MTDENYFRVLSPEVIATTSSPSTMKPKVLGRGASGDVVEAIDENGNLIAKKIFFNDSHGETFFHAPNEIFMLKKFKDHPNIVNFLSSAQKDGVFLINMEIMHSDLFEERGKIAMDIKNVLFQILCALDSLHQNGYIHGDITTSNIFITKGGVYKLGDFGLCQYSNPNVKAHKFKNFITNEEFRAPEVSEDSNTYYDEKCDIWSLGVVILVILFGDDDYLFYSSLNFEGFWVKIREDYDINNKNLLDLLKKIMEFDPSKRISANDALKHDFFESYIIPQVEIFEIPYLNKNLFPDLNVKNFTYTLFVWLLDIFDEYKIDKYLLLYVFDLMKRYIEKKKTDEVLSYPDVKLIVITCMYIVMKRYDGLRSATFDAKECTILFKKSKIDMYKNMELEILKFVDYEIMNPSIEEIYGFCKKNSIEMEKFVKVHKCKFNDNDIDFESFKHYVKKRNTLKEIACA